MTPDIDTLERLALAAQAADPDDDGMPVPWESAVEIPTSPERAYIAACSPDAILSLIATTRRLEAALAELVGVLSEPLAVWDKSWPTRHSDAIFRARAALAGQHGGGE